MFQILASFHYDWPRGRLVLFSVCRVVLVPLMMVSVMPRSRPFLRNDIWPMVISLLLGVTNGYFGSVPMILAPGNVPDAQKELTGAYRFVTCLGTIATVYRKSSSLSFFQFRPYAGSMYDDIRLHVARSYTSSADSHFSLISSLLCPTIIS